MKATEAVERIEKTGAESWPGQAEILAEFYQKECLTKVAVRNGKGDPSESLLEGVIRETSDTWGKKAARLMSWPEGVRQPFFNYQEVKLVAKYINLPERFKEQAVKVKKELEKCAKAAMK